VKKLLIISLALVAAAATHAQGNICLDNIFNTDTSFLATRNGLFFIDSGNGPHLITQDFNVTFYGGTDSANLQLIRSFFGAAAAGDNAFGPGTFIDPTGICAVIAGATNMAFFRIEAWVGSATSYASAFFPKGASPVFRNPVNGPPNAPPDFTEMPAICLGPLEGCVPEPSTSALAGLAAGALLLFRRRK
jgi:hypothetical protein